MASGILGALEITTPNLYHSLYIPPPGTASCVNFNLLNTTNKPIRARLALGTNTNPAKNRHIEWDALIQPGAPLQHNGRVVQGGINCSVYASAPGLVVVADGIEEAASFGSGVLGAIEIATVNTYQSIYLCPAGTLATVNFNLLNTTNKPIRARLALGNNTNPEKRFHIEWDALIQPGAPLQHNGRAISAGVNCTAYASAPGLVVLADGFEEAL